MAALCYSLAFSLLLLRAASAVSPPQCETRDGERVCAVASSPQRLLLLPDRLIVGAIDSIYSFSPSLELLDVGDASPSASRRHECAVVEAHQAALCRNFVRVLQQVNETSLLACGTNAVFPKCRIVRLENLSSWDYMTADGRKDVGFSPHSDVANVAVLAENGAFLTATFFKFRQAQQTIGLAHSLLESEAEFKVQTPSSSPSWLNDPVFLSAYEVGQHVYFLAREPALEVGGGVEFSRVIRVCKNDSGFRLYAGDSTFTFRTFQKARLRCRAAGREGSIPYDYDRLQATFLLRRADGGDPTLYGTFSSAANGPEGAALCKFSFAELDSVFESGEYLVLEEGQWRVESGGTFACEAGSQRSDQEAETQLLLSRVVPATDPQPMLTVLGDEPLFLTADVVEYGGSELEVVVAALRSGEILQLVWYRGVTYRSTIKTVSSEITDMVLHVDHQTNERRVLFTTSSSVESVTLGRCSRHESCFACFDSHDPYCAWSKEAGVCVNKLSTTSLLDSLTSNQETITEVCGSRPPTSPSPTPADPSSCPHTRYPSETPVGTTSASPGTTDGSDATTITPAGLDKKTTEERGENKGLLAGGTVGGFLFGIPVGLVVCYLFFTVFLKKGKTHDQSQEPGAGQLQMERNEKQPLHSGSRSLELPQTVHRNHTYSKNVNQQEGEQEERDILMDLPFSKGSNSLHLSSHPLNHTPYGGPAPSYSATQGISEKDGCISPV